MKIQFSYFCWQCLKDDGNTKESHDKQIKELEVKPHFQIEVNDDNLYEYTCPRGHKTFTQLQEHKFEILFDLGKLAWLYGFSINAVLAKSDTESDRKVFLWVSKVRVSASLRAARP